MHSVLFKKTNIFCYTTFQNISRIRIQLFKTFPGYGSNFSKHFPDPDPTFQNISRIRIQLFKTFPGSGSNFSKHFPEQDPTFQSISLIRIQLFKTFPWSVSNFSKHFPDPDQTFQKVPIRLMFTCIRRFCVMTTKDRFYHPSVSS